MKIWLPWKKRSRRIFLSHSGEHSRKTARFLRQWLPDVHAVFATVWIDEEIPGGKKWSDELYQALIQSRAGIICITPNNVQQPWPVAEFMWLWREPGTPVVPLLLAGAKQNNLSGPMTAVRGVDATDKKQVLGMLAVLAGFSTEAIPADLKAGFERGWPQLQQFVEGLGQEVPDGKAEFDVRHPDTAVDAIRPVLNEFMLSQQQNPLFRVRVFVTRMLLVLGLFTIAGLGFALTPPGKRAVTEILKAVGALGENSGPTVPGTNPPANLRANDVLAAEVERARQLQATNASLVKSNTDLASLVGRLQQQVPEGQTQITNVIFITNAPQVSATGRTNALLSLPTEQINLRSITTHGLSSVPVAGDWLLFISVNPTSSVELYATNGPGGILGKLQFGVPYRVVALQETNVLLQGAHQPELRGWLRGWNSGSKYVALNIGTSGLRIPNWRFVPEAEAMIPGLTPSKLTNLGAPRPPANVRNTVIIQ